MAVNFKKILSLFLVIATLFALSVGVVSPLAEDKVYKLGDVNGNDVIEAEDYLFVKRAVIGTMTLDDVQTLCADVSQNGKVDTRDYALIKRHVLKTYTITGTIIIKDEPKGSDPMGPCPYPVDPSKVAPFKYPDTNYSKPKAQYGYIVINNNMPYFYGDDFTTRPYHIYNARDKLGRCTYAVANLCKELMPTSGRGSISSVEPTGWENNATYGIVNGGKLYNRSHLIAHSLTGQNANWENLISGTTYMNQIVMTTFETQIANYIKSTNNHVLYRVTPIFVGNNLVASGVMVEAYSVEDKGKGICFNVYCYNAQPGIIIDYTTGKSRLA